MGFMTYQTTRFIMYVLNIVLWPLTRVFIFLWIFPEEFVALAFKTASRVFACVLYFFYSSRCIYIDCSIEAHSEREKKKNMHFFLWPARYHSLSIGIVTVGFITSRQNWYVYIYVFIASRCIHRLRRIKSWKK